MKKEEITQLTSAINSSLGSRSHVFDVISKTASVLCAAAITWVMTQIASLDKNISIVQAKQELIIQDTNELKKASKQPKFTLKDHKEAMTAYNQRLKFSEEEIKELKRNIKELQNEWHKR